MNSTLKKAVTAALASLALAQPAQAVLQRQGPTDPAHGFPAWFQDRNGVALELCTINDPVNGLAVVNAGLCAIANLPAPDGISVAPEVFPTNFSTEHFYTLVSGLLNTAGSKANTVTPGSSRVTINMALEASFANGVPTPGQQLWFSRWRVQQFNLPCTGNYTYYTPTNAPQTYPGVAGGRIFETSDVGIGNPAAVMTGSIGPFLQGSDVPGGAVKAPFIGPDGKKYLSDGGGVGSPITGSVIPNPLLGSTNPFVPPEIRTMPYANFVAVEGPGVVDGNCAATQMVSASNTFSLFGRYYEGPIPSRSSVDRVTYRAVDTNGDGNPDTFQVGTWATATQEAGRPVPRLGVSLWFTDPANPANTTAEIGMDGLALPATTTPPPGIIATPQFEFFQGENVAARPNGTGFLASPVYTNARVRVITDTPPSVQDVALVDELRITQAIWNSTAKTLTVAAESGAILQAATPAGGTAANAICSTPCLTLDTYGLPATDAANAAIDFKMKTTATAKAPVASIVIPNVLTPPAFVTVRSTAGGSDSQPVIYQGPGTGTAVFQNDTVNAPMNTPVSIDVFANDIGVAAVPNLTTCDAAGAGCAVPNPATACVVATASAQCTALGGRIALNGNLVTYTPPLNLGGQTDTFWYQAATSTGTTAKAQVTVNISNIAGLPDARDDLGNTAVAGTPATIDVVANDFAPAGIDLATLRITQEPCNFTTTVCAPGAASFGVTPGKLVFNAPSAGTWQMAYTFTDKAGTVADQGVVAVNALGAETLAFQRALWRAGTGTAGTVTANGTSTIALGQPIQLMLNPAGVANGCLNPTTGQVLATTLVAGGGAWIFGAITLPNRPATVYVYSPTFGGCTQTIVQ